MNNDYEFHDYSIDEVKEQYSAVEDREEEFSRYLKDAMLHVAAVSYDAFLEGEISEDVFTDVIDSTRNHVDSYYFQESFEADPAIPNLERNTMQFSRQGHSSRQGAMDELAEAADSGRLEEWYIQETNQSPDRIIGVPGGGIETGMIASLALDLDLDLVRSSPRKRQDESVHDVFERDYNGENVLILDDIREKGRAEKALRAYAEERGADSVVFDAGIPEWDFFER